MKKSTINRLSIGILFLVFATSVAQIESEDQKLKEKIDRYLSQGIAQGFSGSVLIAKRGEIILHKGYGMANKESQIPYTVNTVSTIGSVTKQFTATAILKLEELNALKVTDPISKFFKNLPNDKKSITIHQLLTHTSGLTDVIADGDFDDIPMKRFFKTLFATKLLHKPGSQHYYSNVGYSVLARIIEIVTDNEYEGFLMENLFLPSGMTHTGYLIPDWRNEEIATGYARNLVNMGTLIARYKKLNKVPWNLKGNGGIHSTTGDMFKWYVALKTNKIISKESFKKLTTSYAREFESGTSYYSYGWSISCSSRDTKIIRHNGGNQVFFHDYWYLPEEDVVIILFVNASSREMEVVWPIEKIIFDESYAATPIKKNLFYLAFNFMESHSIEKANELIATIKKDYASNLRSPDALNGLGYRILKNEIVENQNSAKWAVEIFKLNTELFPHDGNIWDSLGEGYLTDNQKSKAKESYEKALTLGENKNCDWCESSTNALKKLNKNN